MVNDIIIGISEKLKESYGDECEIYTEQVAQGLKGPTFSISSVNSEEKPMLGARHLRMNSFSVKYYPKSNASPKAECNIVSDDLFLALQYITVGGDLMQGTNMNSQFVDGVLEFMVNYDFFVQAVHENELMESLLISNKAKG